MISKQKTYGGSDFEGFYTFKEVVDGGYIACGYAWSDDGDVQGQHGWSSPDGWILRLNTNMDTIWTRCLGGTNDEWAYDLVQTPDSGFMICLSSRSSNGNVSASKGGDDFWIVKLDKSGNIIWEKSYGGSYDDYPSSIIRSTDGNYLIAGTSESNDGDVSDHIGNYYVPNGWIIKIDGQGNLLNTKSIIGPGVAGDYLYLFSGRNAPDNHYIIGGYFWGSGSPEYFMAKINDTLNISWYRTYGGSGYDYASMAEPTQDGGFIISGRSSSEDGDVTDHHGTYNYDYWIVKTDSAGNIAWTKSYGGTDNDINYSIFPTCDGGYILGGYSSSKDGDILSPHPLDEGWVAKINSTGSIEWSKPFGGDSLDYWFNIIQLNDGRFAFAGLSKSTNGDLSVNRGKSDGWIGILNSYPLEMTPEICLVTVDSATQKNLIVWEKNGLPGKTASFNIYKEGIATGNYNLIASVPFANESDYIDLASDPKTKANRYKLAAVDSCGNESPMSTEHKTMHLTVNKGTSDEINLIWENYEGFTFGTYILYGGANAQMDSMTAFPNNITSYSIWPPYDTTMTDFVIAVVHPTGCTSTKMIKSYNSSKSNTASLSVNPGMDDNENAESISFFPNPLSENSVITYRTNHLTVASIFVENIFGQHIFTLSENLRLSPGSYRVDAGYLREILPEGFYFIRFSSDKDIMMEKFTVIR